MKRKLKTLSPGDYLKALALFTMANQHYVHGDAYGKQLTDLLGLDKYGGHISDAMLDKGPDFNAALESDGFTVAPKRVR